MIPRKLPNFTDQDLSRNISRHKDHSCFATINNPVSKISADVPRLENPEKPLSSHISSLSKRKVDIGTLCFRDRIEINAAHTAHSLRKESANSLARTGMPVTVKSRAPRWPEKQKKIKVFN